MAVRMIEPSLEVLMKSRALTRDDLKVVCPAEDCNNLALKLTRWKELCPFIGLDASDEEEIDADHKKHKEKKIGLSLFFCCMYVCQWNIMLDSI